MWYWRGTESAAHLTTLCGYPLANRKEQKQIKQPFSGIAMFVRSRPLCRNATTNILTYVIAFGPWRAVDGYLACMVIILPRRSTVRCLFTP